MPRKNHTTPMATPTPFSPFPIKISSLKSQKQITATFRAQQVTSNFCYLELELFKQQFQGKGKIGLRYTFAECNYRIRFYRAIFFAIGILFLGLSFLIFQHNLILFSIFFGNLSLLAKGILMSVSLGFSFTACLIGYSLCAAREASAHLYSKAKRKLFQIYTRKRLDRGIFGLFNIGTNCDKYYSLKHRYQDAVHLIEEYKEETTLLLQKIQLYVSVEEHYRELLFNQALCELYDKLQMCLQTFAQASEIKD